MLGGRAVASYTAGMTAETIACLKITLDRVKPTVLRRIEVPLSIRLDRLHATIQAAMGCGTASPNARSAKSGPARTASR